VGRVGAAVGAGAGAGWVLVVQPIATIAAVADPKTRRELVRMETALIVEERGRGVPVYLLLIPRTGSLVKSLRS
jgi:hypothetical protein